MLADYVDMEYFDEPAKVLQQCVVVGLFKISREQERIILSALDLGNHVSRLHGPDGTACVD